MNEKQNRTQMNEWRTGLNEGHEWMNCMNEWIVGINEGHEWWNCANEWRAQMNELLKLLKNTNERWKWMNKMSEWMGGWNKINAMEIIEMIENIHLNETWQWYTKAIGNCHGSLIVVAAATPSSQKRYDHCKGLLGKKYSARIV